VLLLLSVCPNEAPGLAENHSEKFDELYLKYEAMPGKARKVVKAREVWQAILNAQTETGTPYMLFKDAANAKVSRRLRLASRRSVELIVTGMLTPSRCDVCLSSL
jgi:ribonucleoside-diphosphate reductase alpha chain